MDNFKYRIVKLVGIDPAQEIAKMKKEKAQEEKEAKKMSPVESENCFKIMLKKFKRKPIADVDHLDADNFASVKNPIEIDSSPLKYWPNLAIKHVIIDCSCVNFIDSQGVNGILQVRYMIKKNLITINSGNNFET